MKEIDQNIAKIKTDPRVEFFVKVNVPNQTTNKLTPSFEPTTNRREKLLSSCRQGVVNVFCNISNSKTFVSLLELFSCSVQNKLPWSPKMTTLSCFYAGELFPLYFVLYVWLYPWPEAGESSLGLKAFRFLFSTRPHLSLKGHSMVICQSALLCKNTVKLALDSSSNLVITCMYYYKHRRCLEDLWPTIDLST